MTTAPWLADPRLFGRHDLTVDDIADLPEDLRYELIDGRLVLTPVGVPLHQWLSQKTANAIEDGLPEDLLINIEQAILIDGHNELRPDVLVCPAASAFRSPLPPGDVPLVVEVVSESSKNYDRDGKLKTYAFVGIPHYWIIDPLSDRVTFTEFLLEGGAYRHVRTTDRLVTVVHPWRVTLDLPAWTQKRDFLRHAAHRDQ